MNRGDKISVLWSVLIALLVAGIGAGFTFWVLDPGIGFDDANITQVYARNIAAGHGYVYNVGGERVEGSTSLLWTLINVLAFLISAHPETIIGILSFILTAATILISMRIAGLLSKENGFVPPLLTGVAFLAFPPFFGWMVWSLMDTVLWVFVITCMTGVLLRLELRPQQGRGGQLVMIGILAALLPVTRPEGIALVIAIAGFYALRARFGDKSGSMVIASLVGISGVFSFGLATLWRLWFFGYPFPNTFYAKTSTNFIEQFKQGLRYDIDYFTAPQNILFVLACIATGFLILHRGRPDHKESLWLVGYLIAGGVIVYTCLGGDHFGSNRFFLYFLPIALPVIFQIGDLWSRKAERVFIAVFAIVGLAGAGLFISNQGRLLNEFSIAKDGRQLGLKLNEFPGDPVVAVVAAGGIRMGYKGNIQDLMGLNWTEMAHAPDDGTFTHLPGHQGFNTSVFWNGDPADIFYPYTGQCPEHWQPLEGLIGRATDNISKTEKFQDLYDLVCHDGMVFYASRPYIERVISQTGTFPYYRVE